MFSRSEYSEIVGVLKKITPSFTSPLCNLRELVWKSKLKRVGGTYETLLKDLIKKYGVEKINAVKAHAATIDVACYLCKHDGSRTMCLGCTDNRFFNRKK